MNCTIHNDREAAGICVNCGKPYCDECLVEVNGKMYCKKCIAEIAQGQPESTYMPPPKNKSTATLLCIFLGMLGMHRFYMGYVGEGLAYMLGTILLSWTVICPIFIFACVVADLIAILKDRLYDKYDRPLV